MLAYNVFLVLASCAAAVNAFSLYPRIQLSTEAITNSTWDTVMADFSYKSTNGSIIGAYNVTVPYYYWSSKYNKDTIILVPGRGEPVIKYRETIYDLFRNGFNVLSMDHKGQGFSRPRPCPETPALLAIHDFNEYVDDLSAIIEVYKKKFSWNSFWPAALRKTFIFGHSMGGAISALWLIKNPGKVDAAVLSAPMLQLAFDAPTIASLGELAKTGLCAATPGTATVPSLDINDANFARASTASRLRWTLQKKLEWGKYPQNVLAGSAASWLYQAVVGGEYARANANKATDPILVLSGKNDTTVVPVGSNSFCEGKIPGSNATFPKAPNCKLIEYADSKHEVYNERDFIRTPALTAAIEFFRRC
ncbi:Alpha/Beta hydrolase protein [Cladochytrium replicatum]|nr:Alpha/Beta hydrolase protein [Cladochytrium replicatum]